MNVQQHERRTIYSFGESVDTAMRFYYQNAHEFHRGARLGVLEVSVGAVKELTFSEDWRRVNHQTRFVTFRHDRGLLWHTALQLEAWEYYGPNGELSDDNHYGINGHWRVVQVGVSKGFDTGNNDFYEAYPRFSAGNFDERELSLLRSIVDKLTHSMSQEAMRQALKQANGRLRHPILENCLDVWIERLRWPNRNDDATPVI